MEETASEVLIIDRQLDSFFLLETTWTTRTTIFHAVAKVVCVVLVVVFIRHHTSDCFSRKNTKSYTFVVTYLFTARLVRCMTSEKVHQFYKSGL